MESHDNWFKNFDEVIARLSRAGFVTLWLVLFVRAAELLDEQNQRRLSDFSTWQSDWKVQAIYLATLVSGISAFVMGVIQFGGVLSKYFGGVALWRVNRCFIVIDIVACLLLFTMFILFTTYAWASLFVPAYAELFGS